MTTHSVWMLSVRSCAATLALLAIACSNGALLNRNAYHAAGSSWREPVVLTVEKARSSTVFRIGAKSKPNPLLALGEEVEARGEDWPCVLLVEDRISFDLTADLNLVADKAGFKHIWTFEYNHADGSDYMSEMLFGNGIAFLFTEKGIRFFPNMMGRVGEAPRWDQAVILKLAKTEAGVAYRVNATTVAGSSEATRLMARGRTKAKWAAILLDSKLPVSYGREAPILARAAGFKNVGVFVYGSRQMGRRYMRELSFGPKVPFSKSFDRAVLPERVGTAARRSDR